MENTKKMIIISTEDLQRMQNSHQQIKPNTRRSDTVSELDREMLNLLNNKSLSDQDKWSQYQQVLQRYLHFTSQNRKPIHIPVVDLVSNVKVKHDELKNEELIGTFSKAYKMEIKNILNHIGRRPDKIDWDNDGMVYIDGERVPNSNIVDLLHDVIRAKKATQPPGWEQLMHALKDISTPTEFITNPFARQYLISLKGTPSVTEKSDISVDHSLQPTRVGEEFETGPGSASTPVSRPTRKVRALKWESFKLN